MHDIHYLLKGYFYAFTYILFVLLFTLVIKQNNNKISIKDIILINVIGSLSTWFNFGSHFKLYLPNLLLIVCINIIVLLFVFYTKILNKLHTKTQQYLYIIISLLTAYALEEYIRITHFVSSKINKSYIYHNIYTLHRHHGIYEHHHNHLYILFLTFFFLLLFIIISINYQQILLSVKAIILDYHKASYLRSNIIFILYLLISALLIIIVINSYIHQFYIHTYHIQSGTIIALKSLLLISICDNLFKKLITYTLLFAITEYTIKEIIYAYCTQDTLIDDIYDILIALIMCIAVTIKLKVHYNNRLYGK